MDYAFKRQPREHQLDAWQRSNQHREFALVMEQGTGKTKVTLDTAGYMYGQGQVTCLLALCPSGLQRNWTHKEAPKDLPDHVPFCTYTWTGTPTTKAAKAQLEQLFTPGHHLRVVAMHYEALLVPAAKAFLRQLVRAFKVMVAADESHYIKSPDAKRTDVAIRLASVCAARRLLSGTPFTQSPLDAYSQFKFLNPTILGYQRYATFKRHYAELERVVIPGHGKVDPKTGQRRDAQFDKITGYRNLDELERRVGPYSYRILKAQALDLPPKTYQTRDAELTPQQRKVYDQLLQERVALLGDLPHGVDPEEALWQALMDPDQDSVRAKNALELHLRLQQVLGGYVKLDSGELHELVPPHKNPRMLIAMDEWERSHGGKVVLWSRFKHEVDALAFLFAARTSKTPLYAVRSHGGIKQEERWENAQRFQEDPDCRLFVGTPDSAGRGIDLYAAGKTVYYSSSFNYEHRAQSEDRMHRDGFTGLTALYVDLVAPGTVDDRVVEVLQNKEAMASSFEWGYGQGQKVENQS